MTFKNLVLIHLIVLVLSIRTIAQKQNCEDFNTNSGELIHKGVEAHDKGNYDEAVGYYLKIFPGDTNYYHAQYELGFSYDALKKHEEVVKIAEDLIKLSKGNLVQNTNMLGNALDGLGKVEDALKVYDAALSKYPNEYLLHYNKGITLFLAKRYEEAESEFIKSAQLNPVHQGSHYFLGLTNLMAKRYVQGMMALEYSMILNTQTGRYNYAVQIMDKASILQFPEAKETITLSTDVDKAGAYDAVNEIYSSLLALNEKYKPKKIPNIRVLKQTALFFDNIESISNDDNSFYTKYYLRFFKKIKEKKLVNTFLAQVLSNTNNELLNKFYNSEKKNYEKLVAAFSEFRTEVASKLMISHEGKEYYCIVEYNDKGSINVALELTPDGSDIQQNGIVLVFFQDGGIFKEAHFSNGKLNGECKKYGINGKLTEICTLVDGVEQGEAREFYASGELLTIMNYKDGVIGGEVKIFYPDGKPKLTYHVSNGLRNGNEKRYYHDGKLSADYNYKNGEFEGNMKDYYQNGQIKYEYAYKEEKFEGPFTGYFSNGKVSVEQNYKSGVGVGSYKIYYPNSQVKEEGSFDDKGKKTGVWKTYFYNGTLSNEASYLNGQKEGTGIEFDRDGKKYYEYEYKGGNYTMVRFFDKQGNIIKEFKEEKNVLKYTFYTPEGLRFFDGALKNGKADGLWTTYFTTTNTVFKTVNYLNGELVGDWTEYYGDGVLRHKSTYKKDKQEGIATTYFQDGKTIKNEYCATDGEAAGLVKHYFPNGSKQEELYFLFGEINGPVKNFDLLGRLYRESYYENGSYMGEAIYDSLGAEIFRISTYEGLVPYKKNYPNGKPRCIGTYLNGELHDTLKYFYPDGTLSSVTYYENGNLEGKAVWYDHLGNITEVGNYTNGKLNGARTYYYTNGKISEKYNYMDGEEYGKVQYFYPNGNKEYEVEREAGSNQGWAVWYDESENEVQKTFFRNDDPLYYTYKDKSGKWSNDIIIQEKNGEMKSFHANGKKFLDRKYSGSEMDGNATIYFSDGNIYGSYLYTKGRLNGPVKEFYNNKKIRKEENYWLSEFHGTQKYYNENGTLFKELNFEYGNLNGTCKYYDKNGKLLYTIVYYQDAPIEVK